MVELTPNLLKGQHTGAVSEAKAWESPQIEPPIERVTALGEEGNKLKQNTKHQIL